MPAESVSDPREPGAMSDIAATPKLLSATGLIAWSTMASLAREGILKMISGIVSLRSEG